MFANMSYFVPVRIINYCVSKKVVGGCNEFLYRNVLKDLEGK